MSESYGGLGGTPPLFPPGMNGWAGIGTCSPGHHEPYCGHDASRVWEAPGGLNDRISSAIRATQERRAEAIANLRELQAHADEFGPVVMRGQDLADLLFLITGE